MTQPGEKIDPSAEFQALSGRRLAFGTSLGGAVNVFKVALQLVMLPLMARLLGPGEFGLYALAVPAVTLLIMLADGGLGQSLARETETSEVWSTAFWLFLMTGIGLAACVMGWGFFLSHLMHEPKLGRLMALLSISIIFLSVSICPNARMTRRGWLGFGAMIDFFATLIGAAAAVTLAFHGAGAFSLAVQFVLSYGIRAGIVNWFAFHLPKLEFKLDLLKGHFATGGFIVGGRGADFLCRMLENYAFCRALGTASLGIYTFANQVPRFLCETAGNVIWDALYVQALRVERERAVKLQLQLCRILAIFLLPVTFIISASSHDAISLILGSKWIAAAPVLSIILPSYAFNAIASQNSAILLARGRFGTQFYCGLVLNLSRVLAASLGHWIGMIGIAGAIAGLNMLYFFINTTLSKEVTEIGVFRLARAILGPFMASLAAAFGAWTLDHIGVPGIPRFVGSVAFGTFLYAAALPLIDCKNFRSDIIGIKSLLVR